MMWQPNNVGWNWQKDFVHLHHWRIQRLKTVKNIRPTSSPKVDGTMTATEWEEDSLERWNQPKNITHTWHLFPFFSEDSSHFSERNSWISLLHILCGQQITQSVTKLFPRTGAKFLTVRKFSFFFFFSFFDVNSVEIHVLRWNSFPHVC